MQTIARENAVEVLPEGAAPEGEAVARHYRTGGTVRIRWKSGILENVTPAAQDPSPDLWVAPALCDVQVNGYAGVDFQRDGLTSADLHRAAEGLRRDGCHRAFLTLITAEWPTLLARVKQVRSLLQQEPTLRAAFPGWHIEGPFLSDQPGFVGAHNPDWTSDPTVEQIRELRAATGEDPVLLTLAPERPGSADAIREAARLGFRVSAGHSNASAAHLAAAADAGASAFTHLGNGCPQLLDRHDNILWRVWEESRLVAGIIPDGIHVSPALFRIMHRVLPAERIYWTTDAMAAAGAPPGRYQIGAYEVAVGEDRVVRNVLTGGFAGSALEPIEGIRRGASMLGRSWRDVWDFFSTAPARLMKLPAGLEPGSPAGFCLLRAK